MGMRLLFASALPIYCAPNHRVDKRIVFGRAAPALLVRRDDASARIKD